MKILPSAFFLTILAGSGAAWATDPPPRQGATRPAPAVPSKPEQPPAPEAPPEQPKADKPAAAEAARKKPRRRAVLQQLDQAPLRAAPAPVYAPHLTPPMMPRINPNPVPPPATVNCMGTACTDAAGGSYTGGVGTSLIGPQGRLCTNNGITVQCF